MSSTYEERLLGDYRLKELLHESPLTRTWLAEQVSVSRQVLVDELREPESAGRDQFLADVRAKAAVEHPLVGSVYEAVDEPERCFFAHELLSGSTLEDRKTAGETLPPARLVHLLRRVSEVQLQHESANQTTSPLSLASIHLDNHGVIRFDNLVVAGERAAEDSERDLTHLGKSLPPLVAAGQPAATRLLTLLSWMRGEGLEAPLAWNQVRDFCIQIEQQLAEPVTAPLPDEPPRGRRKSSTAIIAVGGVLALAAVIALALLTRKKTPPPPERPSLPPAVLIPAGNHPMPDGTEESLPAFRISAHEVTIGQYAEFLETLDALAAEQRGTFDHTDQPEDKANHLPDDWSALLAAAKHHGTWNGHAISLDSPVVGVDWWDAAAFAEWKHARLPTQEQWFAALRQSLEAPATIKPGGWMPVTQQEADRTPAGLIGMAGSVAEWTREPAINPANPLGERKWVIIGGSYLKPGSNALTREWIDDRSLRRSDLGFRVIHDPE